MKKWMQKLIDQFDFDIGDENENRPAVDQVSDDRATLLFLIDTYNKHLFEIDGHPVRKVRESLDQFAKELLNPANTKVDRVLFRFRQFFSSYRIDEYTYIQKTFEEFRSIIWEFVDQLGEDLSHEENSDKEVMNNLEKLKEAVEANSIDTLKTQSREFIDFYTEHQVRKESHRSERLDSIRKNLQTMKKQLTEANNNMRLDHLTSAFNRKSFDECIQQHWNYHKVQKNQISLLVLDIDHFKSVNDNYGHAIGDSVIQECVRTLQECFAEDQDFVARIGGEEFAVILPDTDIQMAFKRAEVARHKIKNNALVEDGHKISFTVSMGIAQLKPGESVEEWFKRADAALYESKETGRNKCTLSEAKELDSPVKSDGHVA